MYSTRKREEAIQSDVILNVLSRGHFVHQIMQYRHCRPGMVVGNKNQEKHGLCQIRPDHRTRHGKLCSAGVNAKREIEGVNPCWKRLSNKFVEDPESQDTSK